MKRAPRKPRAAALAARFPDVLRYPAQPEALWTIGVLAVCRVLAYFIPGSGWVLNAMVTVALYKYAAEVLSSSAHGEREAPNGIATPDAVGWTVLRVQVALALATLAMVFWLGHIHAREWIAVPYILLALAMPAALMSAAIDQDTLNALNPVLWWRTLDRMGGGYLVVAALCISISIAEGYATRLDLPLLPRPVDVLIAYGLAHYATVLTFHLLGVMVYEYREVLGFEVKAPVVPLAKPRDQDQSVLDEANAMHAKGEPVAAQQLLGAHLREKGGSDALHQRYRKLLTDNGASAALDEHARSYLNVLIANERWREALDFWTGCRKAQPGLWPSDPEQVEQLCAQAHAQGRSELCLVIANGLHLAHPRHDAVAPSYLLVARAMAEKLGRTAEARNLLDLTLAAYPTAKRRAELQTYRASI